MDTFGLDLFRMSIVAIAYCTCIYTFLSNGTYEHTFHHPILYTITSLSLMLTCLQLYDGA